MIDLQQAMDEMKRRTMFSNRNSLLQALLEMLGQDDGVFRSTYSPGGDDWMNQGGGIGGGGGGWSNGGGDQFVDNYFGQVGRPGGSGSGSGGGIIGPF